MTAAGCGTTATRWQVFPNHRLRLALGLAIGAALTVSAPSSAGASIAYLKDWWSTNGSVWVAHNDGGSPRRLVRSSFPWAIAFARISPNGRLVDYYQASVQPNGGARAMVISVAGGKPRMLAKNAAVLIWSPDSRTIAAILHPRVNDRLVTIDVATGRSRTLATAQCLETPSFAPSGRYLVYAAGPTPSRGVCHDDLYTAPVTGGKIMRLTSNHHSSWPVWGPQWIVFSRWRGSENPTSADLELIKPSGRQLRQLTAQATVQPHARGWSANGQRLITYASALTINAVTGKLKATRKLPSGVFAVALSGDGGTILGTTVVSRAVDGTNVVTLPFNRGRTRTIVRKASDPSWDRGLSSTISASVR